MNCQICGMPMMKVEETTEYGYNTRYVCIGWNFHRSILGINRNKEIKWLHNWNKQNNKSCLSNCFCRRK